MRADEKILFTTLSLNSTTLYTYENQEIQSSLRLNFNEIITTELGSINSPYHQFGSVGNGQYGSLDQEHQIQSGKVKITNGAANLTLHYVKCLSSGNDLITVIGVTMDKFESQFAIKLLDDILVEFINYRQESSSGLEFKKIMFQIIAENESKYALLLQRGYTEEDFASLRYSDKNLTNTLDELNGLKEVLNRNIDILINRGDKLNSILNKTSKLSTNSYDFRRKTVSIRRRFWFSEKRTKILVTLFLMLLSYILIGLHCGFPFYSQCTY